MQRVLDEDYILQHQSSDLTNRGFTKEERLELVESFSDTLYKIYNAFLYEGG
jgi:hypothetical protein